MNGDARHDVVEHGLGRFVVWRAFGVVDRSVAIQIANDDRRRPLRGEHRGHQYRARLANVDLEHGHAGAASALVHSERPEIARDGLIRFSEDHRGMRSFCHGPFDRSFELRLGCGVRVVCDHHGERNGRDDHGEDRDDGADGLESLDCRLCQGIDDEDVREGLVAVVHGSSGSVAKISRFRRKTQDRAL